MEEDAPLPRPEGFVFAFLDLGRTITGKMVYLLVGSDVGKVISPSPGNH